MLEVKQTGQGVRAKMGGCILFQYHRGDTLLNTKNNFNHFYCCVKK